MRDNIIFLNFGIGILYSRYIYIYIIEEKNEMIFFFGENIMTFGLSIKHDKL